MNLQAGKGKLKMKNNYHKIKQYCDRCEKETIFIVEEVQEDWMDDDIDDDNLDQSSLISRMNGDITYNNTCSICDYSYETM